MKRFFERNMILGTKRHRLRSLMVSCVCKQWVKGQIFLPVALFYTSRTRRDTVSLTRYYSCCCGGIAIPSTKARSVQDQYDEGVQLPDKPVVK